MFADRLKQLRTEQKITQVQLAEMLGVSKGTVAMWEIGKREPNYETLNRLSGIFDRRIDYILGYSDDATSVKLSQEDITQIGAWEIEDRYRDIFMAYLALDDYGKTAVDNLIKNEKLRCHEQGSIVPTEEITLAVKVL